MAHPDDHPPHHVLARSSTGSRKELWFCCAAGVGGEKIQQERELHYAGSVGGMREGTEETQGVSTASSAKTTQNRIRVRANSCIPVSPQVPFTKFSRGPVVSQTPHLRDEIKHTQNAL